MTSRLIQIAGAGLSGSVLARQLAEAGFEVTVYETRDHVAGNCHTERDADTGVMVHRYGPHIFHTSDCEVWDYVNQFASFQPYKHRVRAKAGGQVYSLPINLGTINQFYGTAMSPAEAESFIAGQAVRISDPQSFEDLALAMVGPDLYRTFFKGYTEKHWGRSPRELPASILKRLPMRFNYDDAYFDHTWQGLPTGGYTAMVEAMLDHPRITLKLLARLTRADQISGGHVFWSGPLDAYFDYELGRLAYRTLDFQTERVVGDFQGCPVMNYCDPEVPYTRITEHKHFSPWEHHADTIVTRETSRACEPDDIPYYPVRLVEEKAMLSNYVRRAAQTQAITFVGRLGTYRYLDMDVCIREALTTASAFLEAEAQGQILGPFLSDPL